MRKLGTDINLYSFVPQDRSGRVAWCLEELGLSFRRTTLDPMKGENTSVSYLSLHPLGRVPTLVIDDEVLIESSAICQIIEERFGKGKFAPAVGSSDRAAYLKWISLCASHLDPIGFGVSQLDRCEEESHHMRRVAELKDDFDPIALMLERALEAGGPYATGTQFTIADIVVGQNLYWVEDVLLAPYPRIVDYLDRLKARGAAVRSLVFGDT